MSYNLQHNTTKNIAIAPVAHYDFTKLPDTLGTPITAVPNQSTGASPLSAPLDTTRVPTLCAHTLPNGSTIKVANFNPSPGQFLCATPTNSLMAEISDSFTIYAVSTCDTTTTNTARGLVELRNTDPSANSTKKAYHNHMYWSNGEIALGNYQFNASLNDSYAELPASDHLRFGEVELMPNPEGVKDSNDNTYLRSYASMADPIGTGGYRLSGTSAYFNGSALTNHLGPHDRITVGKSSYGAQTNDQGGTQYYHEGKIAEVLIFDSNLTETDRQTVRDYFQEKYDFRARGMVGSKCLAIPDTESSAILDLSTPTTGSSTMVRSYLNKDKIRRTENMIIDTWLYYDDPLEEPITTDSNGLWNDAEATVFEIRFNAYNPVTTGMLLTIDRRYNTLRIMSPTTRHQTTTYRFPINRWFHFRVQIDFDANLMALYIDGVKKYSYGSPASYYNYTRLSYVVFGQPSDATDMYRNSRTGHYYYCSPEGIKIGGFTMRTTPEPLNFDNFNPPKTTDISNTTPGSGAFHVDRKDMGLAPVYETVKTGYHTDLYPKILGEHEQVMSIGANPWNMHNRYMPDLADVDFPHLKYSFRGCTWYLQGNNLRSMAVVKDWFSEKYPNSTNTNSYNCDLQSNWIESFADCKGGTWLANSSWHYFKINYNPIRTLDGLEELGNCARFECTNNNTLTEVDYLDNASWSGCGSILFSNCSNLTTVTPSAFQNMSQLDGIYFTSCTKLSTCPVLHFDGVDQSNNRYYLYCENTNIKDFSPAKSKNLYQLSIQNQQHDDPIDLTFVSEPLSSYCWKILGGGNNYVNPIPSMQQTKLYWVELGGTNVNDIAGFADATKHPRYGEYTGDKFKLHNVTTDDPNESLYEKFACYPGISGVNMVNLGNSGKKITVLDHLDLRGNSELNDMRTFSKSFNHPGRSAFYKHTSHHYAYLFDCNLTNTANSIGCMKDWYQCNYLPMSRNPNLTSLSELFNNNTSVSRSDAIDAKMFLSLDVQDCAITDVSWMLAPNFAGVETLSLKGNPIEYSAWSAIATQLIALKNAGDIKLVDVAMENTSWDNQHKGGGYWYRVNPTHSNTLAGLDMVGRTKDLTVAERTRCVTTQTDANGDPIEVSSTLGPEAQLVIDLWNAGIKLSFTGVGGNWNHSTQGSYYHPHALGRGDYLQTSEAYTCPLPYPPINWP